MVLKTGGKKHPNHDSLTQFVDYSGKLVTCNLIMHFANLGKFIADISCDFARIIVVFHVTQTAQGYCTY